eukprot:UN09971
MSQQAQKSKKRTTSESLQLVLTNQERRAIAYSKWQQIFRSLLNEEINEDKYLGTVQDSMKEFQFVSNAMRETAAYLDEKNLKKLSKLIRNLQQLEKQNMTITMDIQQKILLARPITSKNTNANEHKHRHCSGHGHNEKNLIWRPRLYKEKQQHAEIIEQINDLLSEIKEIKNSLKSAQHIIIHGTTTQIQTDDDCKTQEIRQ